MNIFGIGLPEMGIIGIIALLIFGPDKLPEVMGQAGKLVRDFRGMTANLTGEFEKTMAEARDIGNSIQKELGGMTKEVNNVTNSVRRDLDKSTSTATPAVTSGVTRSANKPAPKAGTGTTTTGTMTSPASAFTSGLPGVVVNQKASKEDPIVDVSLFEIAPVERKSRARRATPTALSSFSLAPLDGDDAALADARANGDLFGDVTPVAAAANPVSTTDDAIKRARDRRRSAGYARQYA
jgi:TatA/E family protein of Tat protein translocase